MTSRTFPLFGHYRFGWTLFWTLMVLLVVALVIGMVEAIRGLDEAWMTPLGVLAVFTGWLLGGAKQNKIRKFLLGFLLGGFLLVLFNSGAFANLNRSLLEALKLNAPLRNPAEIMPRTGPLFYYLYAMVSNFVEYFREISTWSILFIRSQARFNPIVTAQFWGSVLWCALFSTGWMYRHKKHALLAGMPVLALLIGILGYSRQDASGLIMALAAVLFLMVLQEHLVRETRWTENRIDFSEEIRFDVATITVPIVLFILIVAAVIPNISLEDIRSFYNEMVRFEGRDTTELGESIGLEQNPLEGVSESSPANLPRSHLIGAGPELSDILVMVIDTGETFLPPEAQPTAEIPKYYWFGQSYDIYTGDGWQTSPIKNEVISANETIVESRENISRLLTLNVTKSVGTSNVVFASGIPQSIDQRTTVKWREATNEYFGAQLNAREYQVVSPVLDLSTESLISADETPPTEILETYLQIPEDLPARVLDLAESFGNESDTPYLKASAIQNFLRQFEYTLDLPAPPADRDIVDYFLFDLQKGYCDYYASAMVILARAAGIPARLAVGYTTGNYNYSNQEFMITEANAHAWPEIYIAPYGWVPFEPTASLGVFNWIGEPEAPSFPLDTTQEPMESEETPIWLNLLGMLGIIIAILLVGLLWYWIAHRDESARSTTKQIERVYQRSRSHLTNFFAESDNTKTPLEYSQEVFDYLSLHSSGELDKRLAKSVTQHLKSITSLYNHGVFGPQPLPHSQIKQARQNWHKLIINAWILSVMFAIKRS